MHLCWYVHVYVCIPRCEKDSPHLLPFPFRGIHFILQLLDVSVQSLASRLQRLFHNPIVSKDSNRTGRL